MIYGETPSLPKKADRADSAGAMNQSNNTPEGYANAQMLSCRGAPQSFYDQSKRGTLIGISERLAHCAYPLLSISIVIALVA